MSRSLRGAQLSCIWSGNKYLLTASHVPTMTGSRCWQKMSLCPPPSSDKEAERRGGAGEDPSGDTVDQERDQLQGRPFGLEGRQTCARTGGRGQGHGAWGQGQDGRGSGLVAKVQGRAAGVKDRQLTSERKAQRQPQEAAGKTEK